MSFRDKRIWIVGASEGIGAQLARDLSQDGAILYLSARDRQKLESLKGELQGTGHGAFALDVTDQVSIDAAWAGLNRHGMPDIVIYNAGAYEPMSARKYDAETALFVADVNFMGCLRVLDPVLPAFLARNAGHIAITGSVAGFRGLPNAIGYGASKAGLIHLAENLWLDLASTAIKVQLFNPGFVKTRLTDKNSFAMPFLMTPEAASRRIIRALRSRRFETSFPRRFAFLLKCLRYLPNGLYHSLLARPPGTPPWHTPMGQKRN